MPNLVEVNDNQTGISKSTNTGLTTKSWTNFLRPMPHILNC